MRPFKSVENVQPGRSVFDLSHSKLMSADMGQLYVALCEEVVPGDHFSLGTSIVARAMPLVAPLLHQIDITVHTFFVPYRLLWENWEDFITGGVDGTDASVLPRMAYPAIFAGSLWDNLGFPENPGGALTATDTMPLAFPQLAYWRIWNEFYRDETNIAEVDYAAMPDTLARRAWEKDYFTSALPWAQRGIAPSFPITGTLPVDFDFLNAPNNNAWYMTGFVKDANQPPWTVEISSGDPASIASLTNPIWNGTHASSVGPLATVDLATATTFDVNTLRLAWQIQKWMERNARAGVRYTEFLQAHFGVHNKDYRLQRPEYIGGLKSQVIVSEVLQTSESTVTSPQGNLAGHGISVTQERTGKYFATEYGLIMSLLSIMPKPMYSQGINRQWLRRTKYDFFFPEFSTLGEQAIEDAELYWQESDALNKHVLGFQGRYDEMRYKPNIVVGDMRPGASMDYWTLCREFAAPPTLDSTFIECTPDPRAWAVQVGAPQFLIHVGNHIKAVRPIPAMGTPGLVDHH